jgi:hypothetical protein
MRIIRKLSIIAGMMFGLAAYSQTVPEISTTSSRDWLQVGNSNDAYWIENNNWGKGSLTDSQYDQQIGRSTSVGPNGEVAFRTKWSWPAGTTEVKGFPAAIYGGRPGYYSTSNLLDGRPIRLMDGTISQVAPTGRTPGSILPIQLPVQSLRSKFAYRHNITPTGQGQLTFDIWLQSHPQQDRGFLSSSITHEIMIPLSNWGNYGAHNNLANSRNPRWYDHTATIDGRMYHIYITKGSDGCLRFDFSSLNGTYGRFGWKMIAFVPDQMPVAAGEINLAAIINYVATRRDACGQPWATGTEYVASVELGVEPVVGTGDVTVHDFKVWSATSTAPAPAPSPSCSHPEWIGTKRYFPGEIVSRLGKLYVATELSATIWNENSPPEWTPSLWALTACTTPAPSPTPAPTPSPAPAPNPTPAPSPTCPQASTWKNGTAYSTGTIVSYNGRLYQATSSNKNKVPTDTRFWVRYLC